MRSCITGCFVNLLSYYISSLTVIASDEVVPLSIFLKIGQHNYIKANYSEGLSNRNLNRIPQKYRISKFESSPRGKDKIWSVEIETEIRKRMFCLAFIALVANIQNSLAACDYCSSPNNPKHTMCGSLPATPCGTSYTFSDSDIEKILQHHNAIRQRAATGKETNTTSPLPPACEMCDLVVLKYKIGFLN
ncbi:Venom allergen 3 [Armadillidium vulgare]|nr:Venom allergen 3 [Armadillidium vulgare]